MEDFLDIFNQSSLSKQQLIRDILNLPDEHMPSLRQAWRGLFEALDAVVDEPSQREARFAHGLPTEAPALWLERQDRKEPPPDFIRRVYASWLGQGLTQAHLLHLDKSLYNALHKWLGRNTLPADLDLPTKKQMNDRQLAQLGEAAHELRRLPASSLSPEARERQRLYQAARRRPMG